jgi:N-acetylmuramoyl-L-alanine amidase
MVSEFIQKNVTILRILLLITGLIYYVSSTLQASDVNYLLNPTALTGDNVGVKANKGAPALNYSKLSLPKKKGIRVVIDAGHGGHDSGAVGKNSLEKDLVLKMAMKAGELIEKRFPDAEVFQTRTSDVFIPLFRRVQYANELNADIFISVHCNYISNPKTRGTETFVLGLNRAADNLEVAKRENASILLEQNYQANYEGFDPNSTEGHIVSSMYQNNYLEKSIELAANIEDQFGQRHMSKSRGVKQAGFAVLRRSSMPAVLLEAGFLSNEIEEAFLMSDEGQNVIAESISKAFETFYNNNLIKKNEVITKIQSPTEVKSNQDKNTNTMAAANKTPNSQQKILVETSVENVQKFKVQIAAIKNETVDMDSPELRKIGTLSVKKQSDINKYLVGDFVSRASAEIAREKLKNLGYSGAFIVPIIE